MTYSACNYLNNVVIGIQQENTQTQNSIAGYKWRQQEQ